MQGVQTPHISQAQHRHPKPFTLQISTAKVSISARRDQADLKTLFGNEAVAEDFRFIKNTEVGRWLANEENSDDLWDIERLDQSPDDGEGRLDD